MAASAARALARMAVAGVAAFASAAGMAQGSIQESAPGPAHGPGRAGALPAPIVAQADAAPEFRAVRPIRLVPTADGPTPDAPLSFGRRQPAESAPAPTPGAAPAPTPAAASAEPSGPAPAAAAAAASASASEAGPAASVAASQPPAAAARRRAPAPGARANREDEAAALARLRARLEETLARHSGVDARVKVDRNALRVVSRGPTEPPRKTAAPRAASSGTVAPGMAGRSTNAVATMSRPAPAGAAQKRAGGAPERRDWSYRGDTGPAHWASLDPEWSACGADIPQSPIDIRDGIAVGLPPIEFDLPPARLTIRDDGRAIRAVVREGPAIVTLGRRFELREITFHQPSEFRVEGKAFDLSAQLLHRDEQGRVAVVVVLFEVGDESSPRNPVVQTVLDYLPLAQGMLMPVPELKELRDLLPADPGYYNFVGALSSPPCTEGAIWMVMREPLRIPPSQVAIFARIHPMNVRPLQPLAGRLIKQSE